MSNYPVHVVSQDGRHLFDTDMHHPVEAGSTIEILKGFDGKQTELYLVMQVQHRVARIEMTNSKKDDVYKSQRPRVMVKAIVGYN